MTKFRRLKCLFLLAFKGLFFGILNANSSKTNAKFLRFKCQKCLMKLPKSLTQFFAVKRHILALKTPAFSVDEIDP